ncbi:hypothetical protein LINPERHAP1_LOCUS12998 [Linum perenne]
MYGILRSYTFWSHHEEQLGESTSPTDDISVESKTHQLLSDLYPNVDDTSELVADSDEDEHGVYDNETNAEAKRFYKLLDESKTPAYKGCKSSKLSLLVKLLHIKTLESWSNESFTILLKVLKEDILPEDSFLPDSYYEAKKIMQTWVSNT